MPRVFAASAATAICASDKPSSSARSSITIAAVIFGWWNRRGVLRSSATTIAEYVAISAERLRRMRTAARIGWLVLVAEVVFFSIWIWDRVNSGARSVTRGEEIFAWSWLALFTVIGAAGLIAFGRWLDRDAARLELGEPLGEHGRPAACYGNVDRTVAAWRCALQSDAGLARRLGDEQLEIGLVGLHPPGRRRLRRLGQRQNSAVPVECRKMLFECGVIGRAERANDEQPGEHRRHARERRGVAAGHDRERRALRADFAAAHRRVQHRRAFRRDARGEMALPVYGVPVYGLPIDRDAGTDANLCGAPSEPMPVPVYGVPVDGRPAPDAGAKDAGPGPRDAGPIVVPPYGLPIDHLRDAAARDGEVLVMPVYGLTLEVDPEE